MHNIKKCIYIIFIIMCIVSYAIAQEGANIKQEILDVVKIECDRWADEYKKLPCDWKSNNIKTQYTDIDQLFNNMIVENNEWVSIGYSRDRNIIIRVPLTGMQQIVLPKIEQQRDETTGLYGIYYDIWYVIVENNPGISKDLAIRNAHEMTRVDILKNDIYESAKVRLNKLSDLESRWVSLTCSWNDIESIKDPVEYVTKASLFASRYMIRGANIAYRIDNDMQTVLITADSKIENALLYIIEVYKNGDITYRIWVGIYNGDENQENMQFRITLLSVVKGAIECAIDGVGGVAKPYHK
jgi:hypothetical protein